MKRLPDNIWKSPVLLSRLAQEAAFDNPPKNQYWFVVPEGDTRRGTIILKNFEEGFLDIAPHPIQQAFVTELREALQREAHFNGIWMVGWTNPPASGEHLHEDGDNVWKRLTMIWLDEDGDPQYTVESSLPIIEIIDGGVANYITQAERAHDAWSEAYGKKAVKDDFGIKEHQQTQAVLSSLN